MPEIRPKGNGFVKIEVQTHEKYEQMKERKAKTLQLQKQQEMEEQMAVMMKEIKRLKQQVGGK